MTSLFTNRIALEAMHNYRRMERAVSEASMKIGTGSAINQPDDLLYMRSSVERLKSDISTIKISESNLQEGSSILKIYSIALDNMQGTLFEIQERALRGMSSTLSPDDGNILKKDILDLIETYNNFAAFASYSETNVFGRSIDVPFGDGASEHITLLTENFDPTLQDSVFGEVASLTELNNRLTAFEGLKASMIDLKAATTHIEGLTNLQSQLNTLIGVNGTSGSLGFFKAEISNLSNIQVSTSPLTQRISDVYTVLSELQTAVDAVQSHSSPINELNTISDTLSGLIGTNGVGGTLRANVLQIESLAQMTVPISNTTLNTAITDRREVLTDLKTHIQSLKTAALGNDATAFSNALDIYVSYYVAHNDLSAIVNNGFEVVSAFNQYYPNLNFYADYDETELQDELLVTVAPGILTIDTYMNQIDAAIDQIDRIQAPQQNNNQLNDLSGTLKSKLEGRRALLNDLNGYVSALQARSESWDQAEGLAAFLQENNTHLTQYLGLYANSTGGNILDDDGDVVIAYDQNLYNLLKEWHEDYGTDEAARAAIRGIENIPLQVVGWQEGFRLVNDSLREVYSALEHELQTRSSTYSELIQDLENVQDAIAANNNADINAHLASYNTHIVGVNFAATPYQSATDAGGSSVTLSAFAPTSLSLTGLTATTISDVKRAAGDLAAAKTALNNLDLQPIANSGVNTLVSAYNAWNQHQNDLTSLLALNTYGSADWTMENAFSYASGADLLSSQISTAVGNFLGVLETLDSDSNADGVQYADASAAIDLSRFDSRSIFYNNLVSKAQALRTAVDNVSTGGSLGAVQTALNTYTNTLGTTSYGADSVTENGNSYAVSAFNSASYQMSLYGNDLGNYLSKIQAYQTEYNNLDPSYFSAYSDANSNQILAAYADASALNLATVPQTWNESAAHAYAANLSSTSLTTIVSAMTAHINAINELTTVNSHDFEVVWNDAKADSVWISTMYAQAGVQEFVLGTILDYLDQKSLSIHELHGYIADADFVAESMNLSQALIIQQAASVMIEKGQQHMRSLVRILLNE